MLPALDGRPWGVAELPEVHNTIPSHPHPIPATATTYTVSFPKDSHLKNWG